MLAHCTLNLAVLDIATLTLHVHSCHECQHCVERTMHLMGFNLKKTYAYFQPIQVTRVHWKFNEMEWF